MKLLTNNHKTLYPTLDVEERAWLYPPSTCIHRQRDEDRRYSVRELVYLFLPWILMTELMFKCVAHRRRTRIPSSTIRWIRHLSRTIPTFRLDAKKHQIIDYGYLQTYSG